jgi:hypothetical protein
VGVVLVTDADQALIRGLHEIWNLRDASAAALAGGVVGAGAQSKGGVAHLLRFAHHDPELDETGGYSLVVIG